MRPLFFALYFLLVLSVAECVDLVLKNDYFEAKFGTDVKNPLAFGQLTSFKSLQSNHSVIDQIRSSYTGPWGAQIAKNSNLITSIGTKSCDSLKVGESDTTTASFSWENCNGVDFSLHVALTKVGVELVPGLRTLEENITIVDYDIRMPIVRTPTTHYIPSIDAKKKSYLSEDGHVIAYDLAALDDWHGFYFSPHNPTFYAKNIYIADGVVTHSTIFPSEKGNGKQTYVQPWPHLVTTFKGDSWDGNQIYRNWAINNANWVTKPLIARTDGPDYLYNLTFFLCTSWQRNDPTFDYAASDPSAVEYYIQDLADRINLVDGAHLAVHWYVWDLLGFTPGTNASVCNPHGDGNKHGCGFDTHYPEYFPPRNRFKEVVEILQKRNIHVVPYTNGRLFDTTIAKYEEEKAQRFAAKINGATMDLTVLQTSLQGRTQSVMCPATAYWQNIVTGFSLKLMNEYGLDGVYLDQIGAGNASPCRDPTHNHTLGGGDYWFQSYRKMFHIIKKNQSNRHFTMTEGCYESVMGEDGADIQLCRLTRSKKEIYGGYFLSTGGARIFSGPDPQAFAQHLADQFVMGSIMGWTPLYGEMGTMDVYLKHPEVVRYIQALSSSKIASKDWLLFGQLLRPINFENQTSTTSISSAAYMHPYNKSVLCCLTNFDLNTSTSFTVSLEPTQYLLSSNVSYRVSYLNGTSIMTSSPGEPIRFTAELPSLSVIQMVISE